MQDLTLQERRDAILELLQEKGRVKVTDLARYFGVSEVSIRADLAELEARELLSRVHGGAVSGYRSYYNMSLTQRMKTNAEEKKAIAKEIAPLISDNETIIMNAGTTLLYVMRELKDKKITIVTNSIALALEGAENKNFKIILLGGDVDSAYQFTYGVKTLKLLEQYRADTLLLSVDGIDSEKGFSTFYYQEAEICSKMAERAAKTIVAADYSKIGRCAFAKIEMDSPADTIVTNQKASPKYIKRLKEGTAEIILA